ncbi:FkbM family methyltransferase [Synechococcus sp. Minos11]|uniref:FkbM family methyltransferase n=1 Tax=Synechococcus sp. Minos11 TaxID=221341 RepID=UPI002103E78E|nr:FkbM family methyltransferase [Synechococcus sp. Minos11]
MGVGSIANKLELDKVSINMLKRVIKKALRAAGKELTNTEEVNFYRNLDNSSILYSELPETKRDLIAAYLPHSRAQLAQDLFALAFTESTSPRFFVEFGATDGINLSNTWLLEKKLGWNGILAEPAKTWHEALRGNRSCIIDTRCVARTSGSKLQFLEVNNTIEGGSELSGIKKFANNGDWASKIRLSTSKEYEVETISLTDLLDGHNAPTDIQFLSLDTEGSELEILEGYNFEKRTIKSICVEHNYVERNRKAINALLLKKGYVQVLEKVSKWDDWYVLKHN